MSITKCLTDLQSLAKLTRKLEQLQTLRNKITQLEERYMATWEDIKAAVTENDSASDSIVMVLDQVRSELEEMAKRETLDPAELDAVVETLKTNTAEMAKRVVKNTPAEEEPAPEEEKPVEEPTPVEDVPTDVAE